MAVCLGALITAIIQSSGATTVMVVGFVSAGVLNLTQAVGVIMGANIGTTITAWIVSLSQLGSAMEVMKPVFYAPLLIGIGAIMILFSKKEKYHTIGHDIHSIKEHSKTTQKTKDIRHIINCHDFLLHIPLCILCDIHTI